MLERSGRPAIGEIVQPGVDQGDRVVKLHDAAAWLAAIHLTHDLSIKIADISEEIIQQAILSAMSIYKFSITDDLMSMAVNELIKLTKIENNVDLNKFTTICTDVLSPRVTRHNKEKNKRHSTLLKNPLFNFH